MGGTKRERDGELLPPPMPESAVAASTKSFWSGHSITRDDSAAGLVLTLFPNDDDDDVETRALLLLLLPVDSYCSRAPPLAHLVNALEEEDVPTAAGRGAVGDGCFLLLVTTTLLCDGAVVLGAIFIMHC